MPQNIPQPRETVLLMDHLAGTPVCSAQIKNWTKCDPVVSKAVQFISQGWPTSCEETELKPYTRRKWELSVEDGCLLWGRRVVIPPQGRSKILADLGLHAVHPEVSRIKALARSYVWWPGLYETIEQEVAPNVRYTSLLLPQHHSILGSGLVNRGIDDILTMLVPSMVGCF